MNRPAVTPEECFDACHPEESLFADDPRYVDLTSVRGGESLADYIAWCIAETNPPHFHQRLVTGHRGSGKSTELRQLESRLEKRLFFVSYLDVQDIIDPAEVNYLDVLLSLAKAVEQDLREKDIEIDKRLLTGLDRWFAEKILTEEQQKDTERTLKAEFGIGAEVPILARMLSAVTGQIRSGSSRRMSIRLTLEKEVSVFIQLLNNLLGEARASVKRRGFVDLVVIVDGLEKMHYRETPDGQSTHSMLFVQNAEQLKSPECHLIYTIPISLLSNSNLGDAYPDGVFVLPMVNHTCREGKELLYELVSRRVAVESVFEDKVLIYQLIDMSGGSARELMRLVRMSCEGVTNKVSSINTSRSIRWLVREFDRLVRDVDIAPLVNIAKQKRIPNNEASARLMHLRLVHEYYAPDGEPWQDLHPAVRHVRRVKEQLEKIT